MAASEGIAMDIKCSACNSVAVNMTGEPIVCHQPKKNGWYGQQHSVLIPMKCSKCKQNFRVEILSYKERSGIQTENVP